MNPEKVRKVLEEARNSPSMLSGEDTCMSINKGKTEIGVVEQIETNNDRFSNFIHWCFGIERKWDYQLDISNEQFFLLNFLRYKQLGIFRIPRDKPLKFKEGDKVRVWFDRDGRISKMCRL